MLRLMSVMVEIAKNPPPDRTNENEPATEGESVAVGEGS
jgi:hypothetical protein